MEEPDLLKRVSDLEQQVQVLQKTLETSKKADAERVGLLARSQSFARLLIANWVLLSFLSALLIAVYVKYKFDIDYFESYRNASTTKVLSKFYERMGDRMMGRVEWKAAEQDYNTALKINPNNSDAAFGVAKAQVFDPLPGEKYYAPEVVDARLEYLSSRFPDDYQIYFLKALRDRDMGKSDEARSWLAKCIQKNPKFAGCYILLGDMDLAQSRVPEAAASFAKVVELDPSFAVAKNNLAAARIRMSDFTGATQQFEESYQISPYAATAVSLGEAYWYARKFDAALAIHQGASDYMSDNHDPQDRYIDGEWTAGFLPRHPGDVDTISISVPVYTVEQKRAIMHFELSIDHALLGQLDDANREFGIAMNLQPPPRHRQLIQNRMQSVENMVQMSDATRTWLTEHRQMLN